MVRKNNLKIVSIRESVSLCRDGMDAQYTQYLAKAIKLDYRYDKSLFKCPVFLIQVFYDQRDSYTCPKAMQKIVKTKCVVGKVLLFLFFLSFFPSVFVFNNDISKTVQVLTVILAQALIGCVRFY